MGNFPAYHIADSNVPYQGAARIFDAPRVVRRDFPGTSHTLATPAGRRALEDATLEELARLPSGKAQGR